MTSGEAFMTHFKTLLIVYMETQENYVILNQNRRPTGVISI
jgi:hypothetical protein